MANGLSYRPVTSCHLFDAAVSYDNLTLSDMTMGEVGYRKSRSPRPEGSSDKYEEMAEGVSAELLFFDVDFWNRGILFLLLSRGPGVWLEYVFYHRGNTDPYVSSPNDPDLHEL